MPATGLKVHRVGISFEQLHAGSIQDGCTCGKRKAGGTSTDDGYCAVPYLFLLPQRVEEIERAHLLRLHCDGGAVAEKQVALS